MIRVGIIGATGYTGFELIRILLRHRHVRLTYLARRDGRGEDIDEVFPALKGVFHKECGRIDFQKIKESVDLVFLALPHGSSMEYVPEILRQKKNVVDLGADYRMSDSRVYLQFYGGAHKDRANLKTAVYGLPELNREKIKKASLVANPGCYPTVSILSLAPLVAGNLAQADSIVIDAKSGVSGAGKKLASEYLFSECNENFRAYKVGIHQHSPEINQALSKLAGKKVSVVFVPHLLPVNRGIFASVYARLNKKADAEGLTKLYKRFYKNEPFVRILEGGSLPELKNVVNTNFCDLCVKVCEQTVVVLGAIDNLVKGASGQAVQNMNIMRGFQETEGLLG